MLLNPWTGKHVEDCYQKMSQIVLRMLIPDLVLPLISLESQRIPGRQPGPTRSPWPSQPHWSLGVHTLSKMLMSSKTPDFGEEPFTSLAFSHPAQPSFSHELSQYTKVYEKIPHLLANATQTQQQQRGGLAMSSLSASSTGLPNTSQVTGPPAGTGDSLGSGSHASGGASV